MTIENEKLTKDEFIKKLKTSLLRTYDNKIAFYDSREMRSKICKCEITSLEDRWFGIHITKIFIEGKKYDVDHYFEFKLWYSYERILIRKCKYVDDGDYFLDYLKTYNSYASWREYFRECFHCLAKVLLRFDKRRIRF